VIPTMSLAGGTYLHSLNFTVGVRVKGGFDTILGQVGLACWTRLGHGVSAVLLYSERPHLTAWSLVRPELTKRGNLCVNDDSVVSDRYNSPSARDHHYVLEVAEGLFGRFMDTVVHLAPSGVL
jgi:hypothetical protein